MIASDIPNQFVRTRGQTSWQVLQELRFEDQGETASLLIRDNFE